MLVTLSGIVIEVKPVHFSNALSPMFVTLSGIVIEAKPVQPPNAESPMLVTLSGIVIEVKPVHSSNAPLPMLVTLPSIGITLVLHAATNALFFVSIRQFPWLWYTVFSPLTVILVKPVQPLNA